MGLIKVKEINLEWGFPTVELAVQEMVNGLSTAKRQGCRAVVLIHGYGSSGAGGKIKTAIKSKLSSSSLRGLVKSHCGGELWIERKKELIDHCPKLREYEGRVSGNAGVTVVLLK